MGKPSRSFFNICPFLSAFLQHLPLLISSFATFAPSYQLFCNICPFLSTLLQHLPLLISSFATFAPSYQLFCNICPFLSALCNICPFLSALCNICPFLSALLQLCPGLNAYEIQVRYDKHQKCPHWQKVSKTRSSVKYVIPNNPAKYKVY